MDIFLDVARCLEIKGISKGVKTESLFEEKEAFQNQNFSNTTSAIKSDETNEINLIEEEAALQNQNFDNKIYDNKTDETKETNLIEERAYFQNQDIDPTSSIDKTDKTNGLSP